MLMMMLMLNLFAAGYANDCLLISFLFFFFAISLFLIVHGYTHNQPDTRQSKADSFWI